MDQLLCGLSETAYNSTISIGQLKSATDSSMVTELKNYIANMNTLTEIKTLKKDFRSGIREPA